MQLLRQKKESSLTRRLSRASFGPKSGKQNMFQTKRKILKNIEKHKIEIEKGSYLVIILKLMSFVITGGKEMNALQLMVLTYTETSNFGDAKQFEEELDIVTRKMENLSTDLTSLNRELDLV